MPRKSVADLTLVRPRFDGRPKRLLPPANLEPNVREKFLALTQVCRVDHFMASDGPLVVEYCETLVLIEDARARMRASGGAVCADGRVSPWLLVIQRGQRTLTLLSARLRLSPQSRTHTRQMARPVSPPSAYELDDDDAPA
jgi:phage terminase small subunit